ncbi:MAG: hypothetical protein L0Y76_09595, partial [Ignavibacteria bacterium]|nr:hypothetical protein [Ignavibacteria bacterium]
MGIQYQVEGYLLGLFFTAVACVLFFLNVQTFYYLYFLSFFIHLPVYEAFPIKLCLTDILFPLLVSIRLSSYIFEGKSLSSFIPDRKIANLLLLFFGMMLVSYVINFTGHSVKYQLTGILALYRMIQPVIVFILFSEKDLNITFSTIFPFFIIMTIIQIPVVFYQTMLYDLPLGFSIFITGTFSTHHSGMGTFLIIMFYLAYYNFLKTEGTGKKIAAIALMCLVLSL